MKFFAQILIIFGILWLLLGGYYFGLTHNPNRLAFADYKEGQRQVKQVSHKASIPTRVIVPAVTIDLPIVSAEIKNSLWETTNTGASYLTSSPLPGEKGNSIIYGHNWASLFGPLMYVKPGETVTIFYSDGTRKNFIVEYTSTVSANEGSILNQTTDKRIT
ncbi:sortase, partial [Candidatus Microgenomates bacterium]|nr:sortase [Candidatus Microgenomates bacterium]